MIADFGFGVLVVTFLVALYSIFAAVYGDFKKIPALVESARRAMLLTWPLLTVTAGILIYLLVNDHYEVQFVYEVTSRSMPTYLKVTAWWGGQAGSLLFWSWLMSAFASLVTLRAQRARDTTCSACNLRDDPPTPRRDRAKGLTRAASSSRP